MSPNVQNRAFVTAEAGVDNGMLSFRAAFHLRRCIKRFRGTRANISMWRKKEMLIDNYLVALLLRSAPIIKQ